MIIDSKTLTLIDAVKRAGSRAQLAKRLLDSTSDESRALDDVLSEPREVHDAPTKPITIRSLRG